jgi:hypothetical protein
MRSAPAPASEYSFDHFFTFPFFAAIRGSVPAEKRPEKAWWGVSRKKEGRAPLFPTDRTPGIFIRSLFDSGTVKFGIAAKHQLIDESQKYQYSIGTPPKTPAGFPEVLISKYH